MLLENFYKIIHRKEREDGKQEIEIEETGKPDGESIVYSG